MNEDVPVPVTEGGEAHGGGHECHSPREGGVTTEKEGEYTAHTHWEKLTRKTNTHTQIHNQVRYRVDMMAPQRTQGPH